MSTSNFGNLECRMITRLAEQEASTTSKKQDHPRCWMLHFIPIRTSNPKSSFQFQGQSYTRIEQLPMSKLMSTHMHTKAESSFQFPGQSYSLIEQLPVSKLMTEYAQHFIPIKVALWLNSRQCPSWCPSTYTKAESSLQFPGQSYSLIERSPVSCTALHSDSRLWGRVFIPMLRSKLHSDRAVASVQVDVQVCTPRLSLHSNSQVKVTVW